MQPELHQTTERLGTDPLPRLLLRLGLPGVISMISVSVYNLVDTFWVAKLGYQPVAALTAIMPFWVLCVALGAGTGTGVSALTSRRFGERNRDEANHIAGQAFSLSVILGILFLLVIVLLPNQILQICGATPDIMEMGRTYLVILAWGMPFYFMQIIGRSVYNASGDAIRPMLFTLFGQLLNVILDPCFIFGWGFFPKMGIGGAAVATVISMFVSAAITVAYILYNQSVYRIKLSYLRFDWPIIREIYRVGLPSTLLQFTESIVFAIFNNVVAGFGSVALAAMGIAGRISDLAFMPIFGLSNGLLPIIGFSFGAKTRDRLWAAVRLSMLWLVISMGILTVIFEFFAPQTIGLFNKDPELIKIGAPGMRIFLSSLALVGPTVVAATTFQGLNKGKTTLVIALTRQFIFFIPALLLLSKFIGLTGAWISLPVSDTLGCTVAIFWLYREYRLQKKSPEWNTPVKI